MRLLIYLLALISGFSAADAARAEVSPASSVTQTAVAAAEALASQEQVASTIPAGGWADTKTVLGLNSAPLLLVIPTPVSRHDTTQE